MRRVARKARMAVVAAAVVALVGAGCSASGSSGAGSAPPTTSGRPEGSTTTARAPVAPDPAAPRPWADVKAAAAAPYGSITRSVDLVDRSSGESLVPAIKIEIRFDVRRELAEATVDFPAEVSGDGDDGVLEFVWGPDGVWLGGDHVQEKCGRPWVPLVDAVGSADLGVELGTQAGLPLPPFDQIEAQAPVTGTAASGATNYDIDVPAALLVSSSALEDAALRDRLARVDAPAIATLRSDGSVEVAARAPVQDVYPADVLDDLPDEGADLELVGNWYLVPRSTPPGIAVPTDVGVSDDCLDL